jgi:hypothetical protein
VVALDNLLLNRERDRADGTKPVTDVTVIGWRRLLVGSDPRIMRVVIVQENGDLTGRIVVSSVQKFDGAPDEQRDDGHRSDEATPARTRVGERNGSLRVQS